MIQIKRKGINTSIDKWTKNMNRQFTKEWLSKINERMERQIIKDMQINPTIKYFVYNYVKDLKD